MTAYARFQAQLEVELGSIRKSGLYKDEKVITSAQRAEVRTDGGSMVNFCANNYLGLADSAEVQEAAIEAMHTHGFGMASVRFICGTQDIHLELEREVTRFMGTEDTILYASCFDANAGLFETLLGPQDAIISDALNHASIIDGVRLCKAVRKVYKHADMADLEVMLRESADARFRLIATDGVFSMQGDLAPLPEICDLAEKHDAMVMVDDSHATGFIGPSGKGTGEELEVQDRLDVTTSTMGKTFGGASGGFTTGRREIVELLRQRSRPYLFSNSLAPPIVAGALKSLRILQDRPELRERLHDNTRYFRSEIVRLGFDVIPGSHPIVPIMIGDELQNVELVKAVNERGIFCVGFSYPVVPRGEARIRLQMSASHTRNHLDKALAAFEEAGREQGVI
jgi:glycine C-acetyltransferase